MSASPVEVSLVVPVHNGASRLPGSLDALGRLVCARQGAAELVLVDDASDSDAARLLTEFARSVSGVTLLRNETNRGKGASVARGMGAARGAYRVFTDADLAYPIEEVDKMIDELRRGSDVAIACRVLPESRYLMSPSFFHYLYTRHLMSRAFNRVVRLALLPGILDTQAGLKAFTARAAGLIFPRLTVAGFGFDVELLYIARKHGLRVRQAAVEFRYDAEPSTVRFATDGIAMLRDVAKIRWNDWRGRYA